VSASGDTMLLARVTLSLIVVVLLAVLGARLARRLGLRGQGRNLRVLDRLPLSREAFLAVVTVAGRGLVLGVSAQGVQVLTELDGETLAHTYPEPEPSPPGAGRRPPGAGLPGGRLSRGLGGRRDRDLSGRRDRDPGERLSRGLGGRRDRDLSGQRYRNPGERLSRDRDPGERRDRGPGGRRDDIAGVEVGADGVRVTRLHDEVDRPPLVQGTGSVLDPRTWRQAVEALRELTVRRG
jgi:flagellar protein FliO/FliZ